MIYLHMPVTRAYVALARDRFYTYMQLARVSTLCGGLFLATLASALLCLPLPHLWAPLTLAAALLIASADVARNVVGGLVLLGSGTFKAGDFVTFASQGTELKGWIQEVGWLQTTLTAEDLRLAALPNKLAADGLLVNHSRAITKETTYLPYRLVLPFTLPLGDAPRAAGLCVSPLLLPK